MAIIECPHCGKMVSNTVEKCVHCGKPLKETSKIEKEEKVCFNGLTFDERAKVKKEFYRLYPKYELNSEGDSKKFNLLRYIRTAFLAIELLGFISYIFFDINTKEIFGVLGGIFVILGFVGIIMMTVIIKKATKVNIRKKMLCEKKFWKWVTTEKDMTYKVFFSSTKEKEIFDSINVEYEDI